MSSTFEAHLVGGPADGKIYTLREALPYVIIRGLLPRTPEKTNSDSPSYSDYLYLRVGDSRTYVCQNGHSGEGVPLPDRQSREGEGPQASSSAP